jgi:cell division protein FtsL
MLPVSDFKIKKKKSFNLIGKIKVQVLLTFACLVVSLFLVQLVFANSLATDGEKLAKIDQEIQKLNEENTTLKVEIARESSLVTLSQKAKDIGFKKPQAPTP